MYRSKERVFAHTRSLIEVRRADVRIELYLPNYYHKEISFDLEHRKNIVMINQLIFKLHEQRLKLHVKYL